MSKTKESVRIRYSRLEGRKPKNTLVTIRDCDTVYFGIARCNIQLDTFYRKVGTHIAEQRALLAREDEQDRYTSNDGMVLHQSGLRGSVPVNKVSSMIEHFRSIDEYCLSREETAATEPPRFLIAGMKEVEELE